MGSCEVGRPLVLFGCTLLCGDIGVQERVRNKKV